MVFRSVIEKSDIRDEGVASCEEVLMGASEVEKGGFHGVVFLEQTLG